VGDTKHPGTEGGGGDHEWSKQLWCPPSLPPSNPSCFGTGTVLINCREVPVGPKGCESKETREGNLGKV
jgi:hypothetical protein